MDRDTRFDIIIAGAGAAGLTLLWYILHSPSLKTKEILVLDKSIQPVNDKTWCYWESNNLDLSEFIHHSWGELEVGAMGNYISQHLKDYSYNCIRNGDYAEKILSQTKQYSNITFKETGIRKFFNVDDLGVVETDAGTFKAPFIFQSVLKPPDFNQSKVDISLLQHFIGWEIETDSELFNPDKAVFMDFNVKQYNGVTFMYVLPMSSNTALIEYTLFSGSLLDEKEYETAITSYLSDRYKLEESQYKIVRKERGAIPMEDRQFSTWYCKNVMNVGTVGGLTKPTTGYTFTRIHQQSKSIVSDLENGLKPTTEKASSYRFRVYDMMLLHLLDTDPKMSLKIFHDLFNRNRFDSILRFLEEKSNLLQELSIFSSLPYTPFFKAIYKMKHRIFTGA
ncbi:MAG: hypothetical protein JJU37_08210 [Balneolaceae bacterium]|nr:hypothetical protein [Balneolaceae bacterium]